MLGYLGSRVKKLLALANTVRQVKEIKDIQIGKEQIKLSLLIEDMVIYVENSKESTKTSWN